MQAGFLCFAGLLFSSFLRCDGFIVLFLFLLNYILALYVFSYSPLCCISTFFFLGGGESSRGRFVKEPILEKQKIIILRIAK